MTRTGRSPYIRVLMASVAAVALSATLSMAVPAQAEAATRAKTITRSTVLDRAKLWVKHRVPYSQRGYHKGYRRDCSGFVSMAWKVGKSYTTRTLHLVSYKVPRSKARVGDAVLYRGHVVIFGGWKSKSRGTFYAYEEPTWGKVARKRVKSVRGGQVIRRNGIRDDVVLVAKKPTAPVTTPVVTPTQPTVATPVDAAAVTAASVEEREVEKEVAAEPKAEQTAKPETTVTVAATESATD